MDSLLFFWQTRIFWLPETTHLPVSLTRMTQKREPADCFGCFTGGLRVVYLLLPSLRPLSSALEHSGKFSLAPTFQGLRVLSLNVADSQATAAGLLCFTREGQGSRIPVEQCWKPCISQALVSDFLGGLAYIWRTGLPASSLQRGEVTHRELNKRKGRNHTVLIWKVINKNSGRLFFNLLLLLKT